MKRLLIFVLFAIGFLATSAWADYDDKCREVLPKGLEFTHNCQAVKSRINFYNVVPAKAPNDLVNAVVTMPAGTNVKWLVDIETGNLKIEPIIVIPILSNKGSTHDRWTRKDKTVTPSVIDYLGVIGNYGIVPRTVIGSVVSMPLEILVIGGPMLRGSLTPVKLIGGIHLSDVSTGEDVYKLIAVLPGTPLAQGVNTLADLESGASNIIQTWFENYRGAGAMTTVSLLEAGTPLDGSPDTAFGILNLCNTE